MISERERQFSNILDNIAETLDISEAHYEEAKKRFEAVGEWLGKEDSNLARYNPVIYPQGSFRLGTVVRPISKSDEYDIDLVCQIESSKNEISPMKLKEIIGNRLKASRTYARMLEPEGRRCWTLNYADGSKFHMDILPAIPDEYAWLLSYNVPVEFARDSICITDKEASDWLHSNPKGYANWFREQMEVVLLEMKGVVAMESRVEIEDVPDHKVKTPLQRAIQILKRHRDIAFAPDDADKPISIIITTLAAKAYGNEPSVFEALLSMIDKMPGHIETNRGVSWVSNPVNPAENFADKWLDYPVREKKFRDWLVSVKQDIEKTIVAGGLQRISGVLEPVFGKQTVNEAMKKMGTSYLQQRQSGTLKMTAGSGMLGIKGDTKVKKHNFYGV